MITCGHRKPYTLLYCLTYIANGLYLTCILLLQFEKYFALGMKTFLGISMWSNTILVQSFYHWRGTFFLKQIHR